MGFLESPADRLIREAMERGEFDNLPGKGKPLPPQDDAFTPPELRLVHHILKNANVAPEWMQVKEQLDKDRAAISSLWERVAREYPGRRARPASAGPQQDARKQAFAEWHAETRERLEGLLRRVNSGILSLNLKAPAATRPEIPVKAAEEMAHFDADYPPLPDVQVERQKEPERRDPEEILRNVLAARWSRRG